MGGGGCVSISRCFPTKLWDTDLDVEHAPYKSGEKGYLHFQLERCFIFQASTSMGSVEVQFGLCPLSKAGRSVR
jgi:hypothetical protein